MIELKNSSQLDIVDVHRLVHLKTAEFTLFSGSHGTFIKVDHIVSHKIYFNKLKRIEII